MKKAVKNRDASYLNGNLSGADIDELRSEFGPSLFLLAVSTSTDGLCG